MKIFLLKKVKPLLFCQKKKKGKRKKRKLGQYFEGRGLIDQKLREKTLMI